ncbi:hypothetical protein [Citrobacter koseri]|uniref:hypothetical protein n=1 Tax=Citrobacter koseri TaxID=545 RepID=UPI0038926511
MRHIGFSGGSLIVELGTTNDVALFFDTLVFFTKQQSPVEDWTLLTETFYKRYICKEDASSSLILMRKTKEIFSRIHSSSVEWRKLVMSYPNNISLNIESSTLSEIFSRYFSAFEECIESAEVMFDTFKSYPGYRYEPVKVVITDMPWYLEDKNRPLEVYDALGPDDLPFWLR